MLASQDGSQPLPDNDVLHVKTALLHSPNLSMKLRCNTWLKMENMQPSGSFKIRGVGHMCIKAVELRGPSIHFVTAAGINTCLAVAYAARQLNVEATIVLPKIVNQKIFDMIKLEGANLIMLGEDFEESEAHARALLSKMRNGIYIPSSDNPCIWEGNATIIKELEVQLRHEPPAAIICPVGGGGLLNGIIMGLEQVGWKQVPVIAVETHGSNSFQAAVVAGKLVTLPKSKTIAKSLNVRTVSAKSLELSLDHPVVPFAVSDAMAADAVRNFADDHKTLVETACGAALSLCYTQVIRDILPSLTEASDIVVITTGGSDIFLDDLDHFRRKYSNPPIVVKSGSEVFLKLGDSLSSIADVDADHAVAAANGVVPFDNIRQDREAGAMDGFTRVVNSAKDYAHDQRNRIDSSNAIDHARESNMIMTGLDATTAIPALVKQETAGSP
ncbi:hypothetical protein K450DRAFT_238612 [Umbelopsis ramanniana AG]|uniref:L-serine ammonia-lyase n=1 Tax=Umbelopsis ramanniana AG TaxID=1314678 RepID=A0AAD5EAM0_UMBRA|nr:uncharacterized protein K450DRAFT_238612 [Umbelopsis ramanniana AG]KAI8580193.1 hypothetical protein K450DRAFT_238612 [Umbelopsis ramanniana AG]